MFKSIISFISISLILCSCNLKVTNGLNEGHRILDDDISQFKQEGQAEWKIENGVLSCNKGEGFIITDKAYDNFYLKADFYADDEVNSGIFFHCFDSKIGAEDCFEANIWDDHPNQNYRTGAIVGKAIPLEVVDSKNKWSTYEIKISKGEINVWVNTIKTVSQPMNVKYKRPIIFQKFKGGEVKFRNIYIQPLKQ